MKPSQRRRFRNSVSSSALGSSFHEIDGTLPKPILKNHMILLNR